MAISGRRFGFPQPGRVVVILGCRWRFSRMTSQRRSYLLVPLFVALCSIAAGIFSAGGVKAAEPSLDAATLQSSKAFTSVYDLVEKNFADPVKADKAIYKGAIPGMLRELD